MKVKKIVTIKLEEAEIKEILINHLKNVGINAKKINFVINGHNKKGDYLSQMPLEHILDFAICEGEFIKE
jgi:hypothetical protein